MVKKSSLDLIGIYDLPSGNQSLRLDVCLNIRNLAFSIFPKKLAFKIRQLSIYYNSKQYFVSTFSPYFPFLDFPDSLICNSCLVFIIGMLADADRSSNPITLVGFWIVYWLIIFLLAIESYTVSYDSYILFLLSKVEFFQEQFVRCRYIWVLLLLTSHRQLVLGRMLYLQYTFCYFIEIFQLTLLLQSWTQFE